MTRTPRRLLAGLAAGAVAAVTVVGTPGTAEAKRLKDYVALGDSYTASPLTTPPVDSPIGCARSANNYPRLVAAEIGARRFTDVSCSGATTEDFSSPQQTQAGTNPPQYDALYRKVDLVTVGIGGNDIGFGGIVQQCAQLTFADPAAASPCKDYYTAGGTDQLRQRIDAVAPDIATVLDTVRSRTSKRTEVRLVGYPAILPESYLASCPAGGIPYKPADVDYLRGIEKYLNAMLEEQAGAAVDPVAYVDTYGPTIGHDACQPAPLSWINGLFNTGDGIPVHPKGIGQASMAESVLGTL